MAENYINAEKDYMAGMKYKDIAEKYDVSINTVKSWKTRHKWSKDATRKSVHTKTKSVHTKKEVIEPVILSDELTDKQRLFCIYYIKYFNATKAYQKAYDCAYTTAMVEGHRHLRNPKIIPEINRMKKEVADGLMIDASMVLQKYIDIALADITDFLKFGREEEIIYSEDGFPEIDANGNVKTHAYNYIHLNDSREIDGTLLTEVKQGRDGITVKLADKMKAMEVLAKYTDLIPDHFKRQLEEEKLKIAHHKAFGANELEEFEDDGFNDALNATTSEVWGDVDTNTEES
ncbi:terminase small subunit [Psychrobacillus lasiicapitis]|uniref:PBSX phage terminase small subunit-like N-terminal domain-containing protein n=1 Tax=Psychrobacillus lasiicapitis TaxID=1636719 RepID=A0A544TA87_9BACI|nr:terminase small subunit [Psychrobacillus lasiicapitis]TQR14381.1 hypothetical protein FG382_07950 [Psychrobacillus lasiicapitis]GGA31825.1 phage terminase small subunit [Psychrobacillus lasiicapitis]